jgi:hypothetical protein
MITAQDFARLPRATGRPAPMQASVKSSQIPQGIVYVATETSSQPFAEKASILADKPLRIRRFRLE